MPPLYVTQQGAHLRVRNRRLQIERSEEVLARIPLAHVSQVVLFGNIGLTTPAISALLSRSIEVVFLTQSGSYRGHLLGQETPHVPLRRAQYLRLGDEDFKLELAKRIVTAKLRHQRALLQRHNREQEDPEIASAVARVQAGLEQVPRKNVLTSLRGVEGSAAAAYFSGYRRLFGEEWHFTARLRRPPPDPVNAMLSLGYTLLAGIAGGAVSAVGLDPYAGFLHDLAYNRPALGLDLMEEFRPVVDGVVLRLVSEGTIRPEDFRLVKGDTLTGPVRGVLLEEESRKRFIQAFEQRMEAAFTHPVQRRKLPLRQCLLEQARQIRRCVESGTVTFQGMGFR